jgi:hypothetical protein
MDASVPDRALLLSPLTSRLPLDRPFTPALARTAGVDRACLERMHREGTVRRLLRGVYLAATMQETPEVRAAALRLVVQRDAVVVDTTAAWVHGIDLLPARGAEVRPVEVVPALGSTRRPRGCARQLTAHDVRRLAGVRLTTPLRTALDLGRLLPDHLALGAMDALAASGAFTHVQLLAELPRLAGLRGVGQLRALAVQVDARAASLAESALRLRWHQARLPTAVPGLLVCANGRLVRLGLGVERRQYGAVLAGSVAAADLVALQGAGWRVVVLSEERVLHADPATWMRHLEREFHQHLLGQTG